VVANRAAGSLLLQIQVAAICPEVKTRKVTLPPTMSVA
jgi:hypothetical protein